MHESTVGVLNMVINGISAGSMIYVIYLLQKLTHKENNVYNISTASS